MPAVSIAMLSLVFFFSRTIRSFVGSLGMLLLLLLLVVVLLFTIMVDVNIVIMSSLSIHAWGGFNFASDHVSSNALAAAAAFIFAPNLRACFRPTVALTSRKAITFVLIRVLGIYGSGLNH